MEIAGVRQFRPGSIALVVAIDFLHMMNAEERRHLLQTVGGLLMPRGMFLVIDRIPMTTLLPCHEGFDVLNGSGYAALQKAPE
jgi:hypothetical protein